MPKLKPCGSGVDPSGARSRRSLAGALVICVALAGIGSPLLAADTSVAADSIWNLLSDALSSFWTYVTGAETTPPADGSGGTSGAGGGSTTQSGGGDTGCAIDPGGILCPKQP
jgi:hypothetical protein